MLVVSPDDLFRVPELRLLGNVKALSAGDLDRGEASRLPDLLPKGEPWGLLFLENEK